MQGILSERKGKVLSGAPSCTFQESTFTYSAEGRKSKSTASLGFSSLRDLPFRSHFRSFELAREPLPEAAFQGVVHILRHGKCHDLLSPVRRRRDALKT